MLNLKSNETQILLSLVIASFVLVLLLISSESQVYIVLRTLLGSVFLLFLPGFWLTKVFFTENEIDILERIALSFALSISVIPLIVFYSNLAGIKISAVMVWIIVFIVILVCSGYILRKK